MTYQPGHIVEARIRAKDGTETIEEVYLSFIPDDDTPLVNDHCWRYKAKGQAMVKGRVYPIGYVDTTKRPCQDQA